MRWREKQLIWLTYQQLNRQTLRQVTSSIMVRMNPTGTAATTTTTTTTTTAAAMRRCGHSAGPTTQWRPTMEVVWRPSSWSSCSTTSSRRSWSRRSWMGPRTRPSRPTSSPSRPTRRARSLCRLSRARWPSPSSSRWRRTAAELQVNVTLEKKNTEALVCLFVCLHVWCVYGGVVLFVYGPRGTLLNRMNVI